MPLRLDRTDLIGVNRRIDELAPIEFALKIGAQASFAAFVDVALEELGLVLEAGLVTFNRLDLNAGRSNVISRPFLPEHLDAVEALNQGLLEHPLLDWLPQQSGWPVVRLSDVATTEQLAAWPLYRDVLCSIGAAPIRQTGVRRPG